MAVDGARGLVVVSDGDNKLHVLSLSDGSLVRSFGGKGADKGQFHWYWGGVCISPRGTVLVAERHNDRVQEVSIDDGCHIRFLGDDVLERPDYVSVGCSDSEVVVVSEKSLHRVSLLSWTDGSLLARFGGEGSGAGQLKHPRGTRLLASGAGVVVADNSNRRLCIFSLTGAFIQAIAVGKKPYDVVECDGGASFLVSNWECGSVSKVCVATGAVEPFGSKGSGIAHFKYPAALALSRSTVLGGSGSGSCTGVELVVLEVDNKRFQVFRA